MIWIAGADGFKSQWCVVLQNVATGELRTRICPSFAGLSRAVAMRLGQILAQTITIYVDTRPVQVGTDRAAARNDLRVYAVADSVLRW